MLYDIITYLPMFITLFWAIVLLATRGKEGRAKMMFGVFMSVSFLLYLSHAIYFQKVEEIYFFIDPIYTFATLAVYPLFYWYIRQLTTDKVYDFTKLYLLIPAVALSSLTAILYALMESGERSEYTHQFLFGNGVIEQPSTLIKAQTYTYITARISFVIIIIYVYFTGRPIVTKYNKKIANYFSNLNQKTIHWVNRMLNAFIFVSLASITLNTLGRSYFVDSSYLLGIPSFIFSLLFFFLGYLGYHQKYDISNLYMKDIGSSKTTTTIVNNTKKLLTGLSTQFDINKIYQQHELKITDLASLMNTNRTYLSNLINQEFSCSFNEYVNSYRVAEAKKLIKLLPDESLEEIAIKVGYGSLSTFIRTFKLQEGVTPNHFKKTSEK
ncbi:MAG: helix-turn-helix domain-containing protein [Bacteroidales bacterium]|jgi:AraC-like DNA-binding protein|nr:helix-turn-helix domain-containing protein [Bacteroidales bacterium]